MKSADNLSRRDLLRALALATLAASACQEATDYRRMGPPLGP